MSNVAELRVATSLLVLALSACGSTSSSQPPDQATGGDSSSGGTGGTVSVPDAGPGRDSAAAGAGGSGADGASAAPADSGSAPDAAANADAGEAPDAGGPSAGFACNLLVGPSPMMQWFEGGFLKYPGIDPTKWELISVAHHYTDAWAKPGDSAWNTAFDKGHACAQGAMMPERVIFQATQWSHTTAAEWEKDLAGIIENIKTKWPGVKRIELMASTSAPGNMPCPAAGGKNNETIIPTIGYQAIDAMPAKYPGLVVALPHFEVPCNDFIGNGTAPQYAPSATATTGAAVMDVAAIFGKYFAAHP
jgi:hypothetical protein